MKHWIPAVALVAGLYGVPAVANAQEHAPPMGAVITIAPPPPQAEVIPNAPSPNHIWRHGHWRWNGSRYDWEAGGWDVPPHPGEEWTAAHYEPNGAGWGYVPGRWSGGPVHTEYPPPVPVPEVQPAAPGPNYRWTQGHYQWNGSRHFWVGGRWYAPPAGRTYVEPRWEQRGREYHYHGGNWR